MEFSQYVLDTIKSIARMNTECAHSFCSGLRKLSDAAPSEADSHILGIIIGVSELEYSEKDHNFIPFVTFRNGEKSFCLEEINENDRDILCEIIAILGSSSLRAKIAHIVWLLGKDNRYGATAVAEYLEDFRRAFDPDNWRHCFEQISIAYYIARKLGSNTEEYKQVLSAINQMLIQLNGSDTLFLSLSLIELVLKEAPLKDLSIYDSILKILVERNLDVANTNTRLADVTYSVLESLYIRMRKKNELSSYKRKYAYYYEMQAKSFAMANDYLRAIFLLKKACSLYKETDREKLLELRLLLENWQKESLKEMQYQKFGIDTESIYSAIEPAFEGLSLSESIVQFGRYAKIYQVDDIKNKVIENQGKFTFASLFGIVLLNEQGQSVQKLPSVRDAFSADDTDAIRKHMIRYVAERRRLGDSISVIIAYRFLQKFCPFTEEMLDFLVVDNIMIPDGREEIIKQGLCMGLNGNLYAAMHILQPQTEHIFRNLAKVCGDTVTFLNEDGSEQYKPLSSLFKSRKIAECYNEDIIFTFQSFMDDPVGENLRNLTGHGLLEPKSGNSSVSMHFLCLLIFWLSLYCPKTYAMQIALAKKERLGSDETDC